MKKDAMKNDLSLAPSRLPLRNRLCLGTIAALSLLLIGVRAPLAQNGAVFVRSAPLLTVALLFVIAASDRHSAEKLVIDKNSFLFFSLSFFMTIASLGAAPLLYTVASVCVIYGFFTLLSSPIEYTPAHTRHVTASKREAAVAVTRTGAPMTAVLCDGVSDGPLVVMVVDRNYSGGIDGIFDGDDDAVSPILIHQQKKHDGSIKKARHHTASRPISVPARAESTEAHIPTPADDAFRPFRIMLVDHDYSGGIDGIFSDDEVGVSPVTLKKRSAAFSHTAETVNIPAAKKSPSLPASGTKKKLTPEYKSDDTQKLLLMLVDRNYTGGIDGIFDDDDTGVSPVTLTRHATDTDTSALKEKRVSKRPKLRFTVINRDYTGNEDGILPPKRKHFQA